MGEEALTDVILYQYVILSPSSKVIVAVVVAVAPGYLSHLQWANIICFTTKHRASLQINKTHIFWPGFSPLRRSLSGKYNVL